MSKGIRKFVEIDGVHQCVVVETASPASDGYDLLPCPFCGGVAHFDHDDNGWNWIECSQCHVSSKAGVHAMDDCRPMLAEAWNMRVEMSLSLEKQYSERLGRLAQLCDTVIPWVMGPVTDGVAIPDEVRTAIGEIMDYVDAVRP